MHITGEYFTEQLVIPNVGMAKTAPSLDQPDAFLKTIQRLYYEHVVRSTAVLDPLRDETVRAELAWALKRDEDGDTPLHIATAKGKEAAVRRILDIFRRSKMSSDVKNNLLQTPFHLAVITDSSRLVELLIDMDSSCIEVGDRHGNNGIHLAVKHSSKATNYASLRAVIKSSSRTALEARNIYGLAPMHVAAQLNNAQAISLLKEAGADINILDNKEGASPIILASRASQREAAQALLELGANPNIRTTYGGTASQVAGARSDRALSELLAFYDSPYDVARTSTTSQHGNDTCNAPSPSKPVVIAPQHSLVATPEFKSDPSAIAIYGGFPSMPASSSPRYRLPPDPLATVKVERSSPNRNPFPEITRPADSRAPATIDRQFCPPAMFPIVLPLSRDPPTVRLGIDGRRSDEQAGHSFPQTSLRSNKPAQSSASTSQTLRRSPAKRKPVEGVDEPLDLSMSSKKRKAATPLNPSVPNDLTTLTRRNNVIVKTPRGPALSTQQPGLPPPPPVTRPPPPYNAPHRSVIVSAAASHREHPTPGRQRRYRSDEVSHGNGHWISDVAKQALARRRSAPDDMRRGYNGRRQQDLHSYTGCLPPHYLHLLESSGNLPARSSNALKEVSDVLGASRHHLAPALVPERHAVSSMMTLFALPPAPSVIVTSPGPRSTYSDTARERHLADEGCRTRQVKDSVAHFKTNRDDRTVSLSAVSSSFATNSSTSPPKVSGTSSELSSSTSSSEPLAVSPPTFSPSIATSSSNDLTSPNVFVSKQKKSERKSALPELGLRLCVATSGKHSCPACSRSQESEVPSTYECVLHQKIKPYTKYVNASSASSPRVVFSCEARRPNQLVVPNAVAPPPKSPSSRPSHQPPTVAPAVSPPARTSECLVEMSLARQQLNRDVPKTNKKQYIFKKTSFSDSDCLDLASDDSGTDVTEPTFEPTKQPRELAKISRKNSLDAKMEQLRWKALNNHQSRYLHQCVKELRKRDVNVDAHPDQEDLLANSIEDSESEEEDVEATHQGWKQTSLPVSQSLPSTIDQVPANRCAIKRETKECRKSATVNGINQARTTLATTRIVSNEAESAAVLLKSRIWPQTKVVGKDFSPFRYLKHPPMLLYYSALQREFQQPARIQIFPPRARARLGDCCSNADDLELSDLEISDDEDFFPAKPKVARRADVRV